MCSSPRASSAYAPPSPRDCFTGQGMSSRDCRGSAEMPYYQGVLMSTGTELGELHQLIADLRVCAKSLVSTYGECPATRRIVNDAERIINGIERLDIDVEEL